MSIQSTCLSSDDIELLCDPAVVGVILFAHNYQNRQQFSNLIDQIRSLREPSLLIAMDHEGGRVFRLAVYHDTGLTHTPPIGCLSAEYQDDPLRALSIAQAIGQVHAYELRLLGIDLSFSPVLDIRHVDSQVIGERAFSDDTTAVIDLASSMILGMNSFGMASVGKHYPGHGGVSGDTHHEQAVDMRSLEELRHTDLKPYAVLSGMLGGIMTGHVRFPRISAELPFCSMEWLSLLRDEYRYEGAIMSDDLMMAAAQTASRALFFKKIQNAMSHGCDYFILCHDGEMMRDFCRTVDLSDEESRERAYTSLAPKNSLRAEYAQSYQEALTLVQGWQAQQHC